MAMLTSAFCLSKLVQTGDVVDALTKYGPICLFGIGFLIFLILAILSWKEYVHGKRK